MHSSIGRSKQAGKVSFPAEFFDNQKISERKVLTVRKKVPTVCKNLLTVRKNCCWPSENLVCPPPEFVDTSALSRVTKSFIFPELQQVFFTISNFFLTIIHLIIASSYLHFASLWLGMEAIFTSGVSRVFNLFRIPLVWSYCLSLNEFRSLSTLLAPDSSCRSLPTWPPVWTWLTGFLMPLISGLNSSVWHSLIRKNVHSYQPHYLPLCFQLRQECPSQKCQ